MKLKTYQFSREKGWDNNPDTGLDSPQTLLLFFGAADQNIVVPHLEVLSQAFPQSALVGCSSAGEIFGDDVFDDSISLAIIQFQDTIFKISGDHINRDTDSKTAGKNIAEALRNDSLRSVIVLSDGLAVNGSKLIDGLSDALPEGVVITGGLAGDGDRFEKTWVWSNGKIQTDYICAIGFYGENLRVSHGSRGGWDVLGPEREVTRATDNILFELDGQPALQLYKTYLGDRAEGLPATGLLFPLSISSDDANEENVVRTILAVDENNNSITFAGDIPQGSRVQLMRANFDRLIDGAADAAEAIDVSDYESGPLLSIAISCVGRRLVLGPRTEEEIDAALTSMPEGTKQIGFYSYGEISPLANGRCDLHNQTMTLTSLWEHA